ncbi:hypothetical protein [Spirillospora sp. NBC_01491]|uniref:hypothetical protein n=1 Tax=Spirillospora sp. NBC_01491 TaxID=2976007 RepID=UPI002E379C31|nr:hypothetical protein [Spirillospora sp. NBC_01491]
MRVGWAYDRVDARGGAGVREPGPLGDGQRVEVGAQQHGRAVAVAQQPGDAGAADAGGGLQTEAAEPPGDLGGRALLGEGQLRMGVQVLVERGQAGPDPVQPGEDRVGVGGHTVLLPG